MPAVIMARGMCTMAVPFAATATWTMATSVVSDQL